jgi:hypothetical protein
MVSGALGIEITRQAFDCGTGRQNAHCLISLAKRRNSANRQRSRQSISRRMLIISDSR